MKRLLIPIAAALSGFALAGLLGSPIVPSRAADPPAARVTDDLTVARHFQVGPNTGAQSPIQAPIDVYWDQPGRKLHARSLILTEVDDPVDLRIRRAPGKFPDGPVTGTSPAGTVSGGIHWDALTLSGWRQVAGIEGMAKDLPAPPPTPASHPGWLTFYTYPHDYDDRLRRVILDDTGAMSLGGGGYGGDGLPAPRYGLHLFGGGMRLQAVATPEAPTISVVGRAGNTRYEYRIVARDSKGNPTPPGPAASIVGPDTLDSNNYIKIQWSRSEGAETYHVLRNGQRLNLDFRGEGGMKTLHDIGTATVPYEAAARNRTADAQVDGALVAGQGLSTPGTCQPPPLAVDQDDYAPAGIAECSTLALRATAPTQLGGLVAPATQGRWLLLVNAGDAPILLIDDHDRSQPANRFRTGTGKPLVIEPNQTVLTVYTLGRWRFPNHSR
ncbi:MAG TPA: hypothetical protein VH475_17570 [Tepidisphaeraceae bacterium]|jgi:hypothetical protein